jgi:hypothetical protein
MRNEGRMERETVTVSRKEIHRFELLQHVLDGELTLKAVAEALGVSYQQAKRFNAKAAEAGLAGLVHGNRGRAPAHAKGEALRPRGFLHRGDDGHEHRRLQHLHQGELHHGRAPHPGGELYRHAHQWGLPVNRELHGYFLELPDGLVLELQRRRNQLPVL